MFGHDHKVKLICLCAFQNRCKGSSAVTTQKRVDVNDSSVFPEVSAIFYGRMRGVKLLYGRLEAAQPITAINKRKLREDYQSKHAKADLFPAFHFQIDRRTRWAMDSARLAINLRNQLKPRVR